MKQNVAKDARARAQAARRVAQLIREATPLTKNEILEGLGSAFHLPQEEMDEPFSPTEWQAAVLEEVVSKAAEVAPKRRSRAFSYDFTAEQIAELREVRRLSWRQIAVNLDLGRSGAARLAYKRLTGNDPRELQTVTRRVRTVNNSTGQRRKFLSPEWNDDSDQDEIIEALTRATILVRRNCKGTKFDEEIKVGTVQRLTWDGPAEELCVHFSDWDNGGTRSVLVRTIKEVR